MSIARNSVLAVALLVALPPLASAQTLGTFRWQMRPYCNLLTLTVTQVGGVYRVEGTDDECGAGRDRASVGGLAIHESRRQHRHGLDDRHPPGARPCTSRSRSRWPA